MTRLFTTILPSLIAGGLLFGSALTGAQPAPPTPPAPPTAVSPKPPKPPKPPKVKADIQIDLGDIDQMVDQQIQHALQAIGSNPQIPPHVREAVKQRLEKVRIKVKKRIAKISPDDLEQMGEELGKMGEEIGDEMEQFGKDMEKWGKQFEKQIEKQMEQQMKGKRVMVFKGQHDVDVDIDDDFPGMDDMNEADGLDDAIKDLGDLQLAPAQRSQLKDLRKDSDAKVANAKKQLETASETLRKQLESGNANESEIARAIDNVTKAEGDIRKARILAWVKARSILDASQRDKVERSARGGRSR